MQQRELDRPLGEYFTGEVAGERYRVFVTGAETIRLARENVGGGNGNFPIGRIKSGHSGFNQPDAGRREIRGLRRI